MDRQNENSGLAFGAALILALPIFCVGGCILPIPTIPLNLPAHGHSYAVLDRDGEMAGKGILVVHTYYHYHEHGRVDCYPIRNGQAKLPYTTDVRVMLMPMFGYFSWIVPTYYIFFINAHHAHVYPFVPGHVPWNDFDPVIDDGEHIYGVRPRPTALRMYPISPLAELKHLSEARWKLQRYPKNASRDRKEECASSYSLHNGSEAQKALAYIDARIKALAEPVSLRDLLDTAGSEQVSEVPPRVRSEWRRSLCRSGFGLSDRERAFRALAVDDNQTLKALLEKGLNPNAYGKGPWTLLHRAIDNGNMEAVEVLIAHGADVNRVMPCFADGWYAFPHLEDRSKYAEIQDGYSPLVLAAAGGHPEIVKLLQKHEAHVQASLCESCGGLNCGRMGSEGYSCLHAATQVILKIHQIDSPGRYQTVEHLLNNGADVNQATKSGITPIHNAAKAGFVRTANLLIKHGADVNAQDQSGQTPLHLAAKATHPAMCELLLRNGADTTVRDLGGGTPLSLAKSQVDKIETRRWRTATIELLQKGSSASAAGDASPLQ